MERTKKVGIVGLVFITLGAMTGASIYNLPATLAAGASTGAIILAWLITGVGMFCLGMTFKTLSELRPELNAGIFAYAREGFGRFAGFEMAWGYWVAGAMSNIGYVIIALDALKIFFPDSHLTMRLPMFIIGSIFMWSICGICICGVRAASLLNIIANIGNYIPLLFFFAVVATFFSFEGLSEDFWGKEFGNFGTLSDQIKSSMLITLWMFIGVEGAVVLSAKAKRQKDVGTATMVGVVVSLVLCVFVSVLPQGAIRHTELASMATPSAAYILKHLVGYWGAVVVNVGVLLAIVGSWIAWTMMVAEVPAAAAGEGVFPEIFARENKREAPYVSILITGAAMQLGMVVVLLAKNAWTFVLDITGVMILPVYLFSALFLLQESFRSEQFEFSGSIGKNGAVVFAVVAVGFATWMLFAARPDLFWLSSVLWCAGLFVFWKACKEKGNVTLSIGDKVGICCVILAAISSLLALHQGWIDI